MDIRMSNIALPMPQIRAKFTNKLGIPLSGCKVYTYEPNSDIPKTTWIDTDKTVENTNPILLDAAGEADIFLDGLYRVVVKDRFGFVVYDVEKTGTRTEWDASFVVDASGETQQQVNYNGGAKWHSRVGGYQENERVVLANGDIVKSTIDGNTNNPNVDMTGWQKGESYNTLNPRNFGVVGDGVTDDSDALDGLISYMQSIAKMDERWFNMQGRGVDFSGLTCLISRPLNLSGFSNYTLVSPSFIAAPSFTGDALIKIAKYNPAQWHNHNITFIEPYLDCAWNCNYGLMLTDYIQVKVIGGYITQYRKKGINAVRSGAYSHELNLIGTFIFQVEAGRTYPVDIVDGEAWFVDSPDNNFTAVVVGPQKVACGTATAGPSHYANCHFYPVNKKLYGSTSDHFIGCYFDGCELVLGARTTVNGCLFVVLDGGFALTFPKDNFSIRVTDNQFRKLGANTSVINYPTVAERGIYRPAVTDNWFDNCPSFKTYGKEWITGKSATSVTFTIPDQYLPLAIHAFGGWTDQAGNAGVGDMFITTELTTPNTLTVKAYKVNAAGALLPQALTGRSLYVALNV